MSGLSPRMLSPRAMVLTRRRTTSRARSSSRPDHAPRRDGRSCPSLFQRMAGRMPTLRSWSAGCAPTPRESLSSSPLPGSRPTGGAMPPRCSWRAPPPWSLGAARCRSLLTASTDAARSCAASSRTALFAVPHSPTPWAHLWLRVHPRPLYHVSDQLLLLPPSSVLFAVAAPTAPAASIMLLPHPLFPCLSCRAHSPDSAV